MSRSARILSLVAGGGWPELCWLDGGEDGRGFLGLRPDLQIEVDDLGALERVHELWRAEPDRIWIGWLTYDLGADALLGRSPRRYPLPGLVLRRFAGALELRAGEAPVEHGDATACAELHWALEDAAPHEPAPWPLEALEAELDPAEYRKRVERVREHIARGDTYQVNLSQRFFARARRDGLSVHERAAHIYSRLRSASPASMGGLVRAGDRTILSNSPETLLDVRWTGDMDEAVASSWPIKGTRPRGEDPGTDRANRDALVASRKDLAEHVMIVDLVRNDLGRLAVPGSVQAPAQPEVVSLPTVHHLVSEVTGRLRPGWTLGSLAGALFPGGSVTGAPKRRTVELIDALEDVPRGIYCGAVVVLEPAGTRWSIPIRTGVLDAEGLWLHAGGGVVADSDPEGERVESVVKTWAFDPGHAPPGYAG